METGGLIPGSRLATGHANDRHVTAYYGVAPSILREMIDRWRATQPPHPIASYTFVDIGAGKGRAMLVASQFPFRQVIGVELNPELAVIARANLMRWQALHGTDPTATPLAPLELREQDALKMELPAGPVLLFLFHPFEAPVMSKLLRRIETQLAANPSAAVDLLYVNAECAATLERNPGFRRLWMGKVAMSTEDHAAELAVIATQEEYGTTGDEECAIYRYIGRAAAANG